MKMRKHVSFVTLGLLLQIPLIGWGDPLKLQLQKNDAPLSATNPAALTNAAVAPASPLAAAIRPSTPNGGQVVPLSSNASGIPVVAQAGTNSAVTPVVVTFDGQDYGLKPNPVGIFPRMTIPANALVAVHMNTSPQNQIEVILLDGGVVSVKDRSSVQLADQSGNINFTFSAPGNPGNHRIALVANGKKQMLRFWIGPDLPMKVSAGNN